MKSVMIALRWVSERRCVLLHSHATSCSSGLRVDPLMSECLIYQLKPGRTTVGRLDSDKPAAIRLSGESIGEEHCYFENNDGKVTLHALPDGVTVCPLLFSLSISS